MEIEKKYLGASFPFDLEQYPYCHIEQSYLSTDPTIRIRKTNDAYFLTVKGKGDIARAEFELPLSKDQYHRLLKKTDCRPIIKKRFFVPLDHSLTAEIDVYEGKLSGLITIEVEFETIFDAQSFCPPLWFGKDISTDHRYKNSSLYEHGLPTEN